MKKRITAEILVVLLLVAQTVTGWSTTAIADNSAFGVDAYNYMNYLQTNYPSRVVGTPNEKAAEAWLIQEVNAMGYPTRVVPTQWDQEGIHYEGDAIIFEKPGNSSRKIVVGAHYDSVDTNGADDNASGVALLLETAKRMIDVPTQYTIQFALFSIEEPGCMGSQYFVWQEGQAYYDSIAVMINLDTIGAGDNMYVYGGGLDENGNPVRTWGAYQALATAQDLGLNITFHPDVNPSYPTPVKNTASDHIAYEFRGIPYIYFEASNWNGGNFTNFYQTADSRVPDGKMMHTWMDNLSFYNETFPGRVQNHLTSYSILLNTLLRNLVEGSAASVAPKSEPAVTTEPETEAPTEPELQYTEVRERVYAISDVNVRAGAGTNYESYGVIPTGTEVMRTGYHEEWSRIEYEGTMAYIASRFLSTEMPETTTEAVETSTAETTMEETTAEESTAETEAMLEETEAEIQTEAAAAESTGELPSTEAAEEKAPEEHSGAWKVLPWAFAGAALGVAGAIIRSRRRRK